MEQLEPVEAAAKAHWEAKRYSTSRQWDELPQSERTKAVRNMEAAIGASITALQEKLESAKRIISEGIELLDNGNTVEAALRYRWCGKARTTLKNIDGEG